MFTYLILFALHFHLYVDLNRLSLLTALGLQAKNSWMKVQDYAVERGLSFTKITQYTVRYKGIGAARQIPLFLQYTEYIWGWDKKMNTRQMFRFFFRRVSAFISWYLHLDVLNDLEHSTFGIRPPNF